MEEYGITFLAKEDSHTIFVYQLQINENTRELEYKLVHSGSKLLKNN